MRRVLAVCALFLGVLIVPRTAGASSHVTLQGPDVAGYYAVVHLRGITPRPQQDVVVYTRPLWSRTWTRHDPIRSAADRTYEYPLRLRNDYAYYATSGGTRSYASVTRVRRASCTVGPRAFSTLPVDTAGADDAFPAYAGFTAVRDGTWAGTAGNVSYGRINVIRWRPGHAPVVLARYQYQGVAFEPSAHGSVDVVAITPKGSVVASVQGVHTTGGLNERRAAVVWTRDGRRIRLAASPAWHTVRPVAVADDGTIVGEAHTGGDWRKRTGAVVTWSSASAPYHVVSRLGPFAGGVSADALGNISWYDGDFHTVVALASGRQTDVAVVASYPTTTTDTAAGRYTYANTQAGTVRWNPGSVRGAEPVDAVRVAGDGRTGVVVAAGRSGDFIFGIPSRRLLRTSRAQLVELPPEQTLYSSYALAGNAIDAAGRVAFTSAADHRIHFLTCH